LAMCDYRKENFGKCAKPEYSWKGTPEAGTICFTKSQLIAPSIKKTIGGVREGQLLSIANQPHLPHRGEKRKQSVEMSSKLSRLKEEGGL